MTPPTRLGFRMFRALFYLGAVPTAEAPPTAAELAHLAARSLTTDDIDAIPSSTDIESTGAALGRLEARGFARPVGEALTGARTWEITPAGRTFLDELGPTQ